MTPAYSINVDRSRNLVAIALSGFFEASDVARFDRERQAAYKALNCAANGHLTLIDVVQCKIQAQGIVEAFAAMISDPSLQSRRLAFVTGGSLAKMQVRRLLDRRSNARHFDDRASAEAWLIAGDGVSPRF